MKNESDKLYECLPSKNDLVGVEFTKDIPNIYFPLGYRIPSDEGEKLKSILDILQTLSLCKEDGSFENYDYNSDNANVIPINSYLWIINDYLKNGLYNVYEKKYIQSQKGKINWKRTLRTKAIYDNDEIYYLNPITEVKTKYDNIITEIHAICVNISINKLGWLFGKIPLVEGVVDTYDSDMYLDVLNNELAKTFNDNKKTLIRHLINILKEKIDDDELDVVNNLLTTKYYNAWEKMIDSVFGNVNNKEDFFPEIVWQLDGKNPENTMRPDTIIEKDKKIYIVDAKYYKYGVEENGSLPGAEAIDKQLTYGEYNVYKQKTEYVYNAFIMPFDMNDNLFKSDVPLKTIGTVKSVGRDKDHLYENIVILLMDTKYLIDLYYNKNGINDRLSANRLLIDSILDEIKLLKKKKHNS